MLKLKIKLLREEFLSKQKLLLQGNCLHCIVLMAFMRSELNIMNTRTSSQYMCILCGIAEREEEQDSMEKLQKRGKVVIIKIYKIF